MASEQNLIFLNVTDYTKYNKKNYYQPTKLNI